MKDEDIQFDPRGFGFRHIDEFQESLQFFELDIGFDNTKPDLYRLNTYLTQDGDFVTVWWGLFDAYITQSVMGEKIPESFNFQEQYNEELFRGHIKNKAEAEIILQAIRFNKRKPQQLTFSDENGLSCDFLK